MLQVVTKNELAKIKEREVDETRLEVSPVANEESVAKAEWDAAAQISKAAAARAAEAKKARKTAKHHHAKLLEQADKDAVRTHARAQSAAACGLKGRV